MRAVTLSNAIDRLLFEVGACQLNSKTQNKMDITLFAGIDRLAMELNRFNLGILASQDSFGSAPANGKAGGFVAGLVE